MNVMPGFLRAGETENVSELEAMAAGGSASLAAANGDQDQSSWQKPYTGFLASL
jgi:hypothetical protein